MSESAYSSAVLDHFRSPRCAGSLPAGAHEAGPIATGEAGDADEGRLIRIQLQCDAESRVVDARFKAFGCPATIACGSWVCEHVTGLYRADAVRLDPSRVAEALGLESRHATAAVLAVAALREALGDAIVRVPPTPYDEEIR